MKTFLQTKELIEQDEILMDVEVEEIHNYALLHEDENTVYFIYILFYSILISSPTDFGTHYVRKKLSM